MRALFVASAYLRVRWWFSRIRPLFRVIAQEKSSPA